MVFQMIKRMSTIFKGLGGCDHRNVNTQHLGADGNVHSNVSPANFSGLGRPMSNSEWALDAFCKHGGLGLRWRNFVLTYSPNVSVGVTLFRCLAYRIWRVPMHAQGSDPEHDTRCTLFIPQTHRWWGRHGMPFETRQASKNTCTQ